MAKPIRGRSFSNRSSLKKSFRLGQRMSGAGRSVERETFRLLKDGAEISHEGFLRPTRKQVESLRKGFERLEKSKTNLFSKVGALAFASELSRAGEHYGAGWIRALAGDRAGALGIAEQLSRAGEHSDAGWIRALAGDRAGAVKDAEQLSRAGKHYDAGRIRALAGDRAGALGIAEQLSRAGKHYGAGWIRALAVEGSLSKTKQQKLIFKIQFY